MTFFGGDLLEETVLFACEYDEQPLDIFPVRTYQFFTSPQRILCNCAAVLLLIYFFVLYVKYQDPLYIVCVSILFYFIGEPFFRYHRAKKTLLAGFEESRVIRGGIEHFHVCFSDASFKVSAETGESSRAGYELGYDQIKLTLYSKEYILLQTTIGETVSLQRNAFFIGDDKSLLDFLRKKKVKVRHAGG